jgi:coenzyme F420 hydrogenase subunit beta
MPRAVLTLEEIVRNGLCIGCGLCQSIGGAARVQLAMTESGRERPIAVAPLDQETLRLINDVCPGTRIEGAEPARLPADVRTDPVWGPWRRMAIGYAGDPEIRHRGSTGGVLTALGQYLLGVGEVDFILHVAASREAPMRSSRQISFDAAQVLEGTGSRYGPAAPLVDFLEILDRNRPFAFIGKPCDVNAVRNLARHDARVDRLMRYALTFVCGGASDLGKSEDVLQGFGLTEEELTLFRYRGFGNPGPTRLETRDGRVFETTYQEMWADEAGWRIQPRCKICPDAIGEGADIAASDVWPGGGPTGEDEGFNGILVRSEVGRRLFEAALRDGAIAIDREIGPRDMDVFQPHQVRKKKAVWARLAGMRAAGMATPAVTGLRIEDLARANSLAENLTEARGSLRRAGAGRLGESAPKPRKSPSVK